MTKIEKIRAWKKKWGMDDFAMMPGGRAMKSFEPDRAALSKAAGLLDEGKGKERYLEQIKNPEARRLSALAKALPKGNEKLATQLHREATRIELTDEAPKIDLLKEAAEALRDTRKEEAADLDDWVDNIEHPYDPTEAPLYRSIEDRIRDRNVLDRTAAVDQVTDKVYSTDRREELETLTGGHYIAKEFALRAIREEERTLQRVGEKRAGIRFDHDASSTYQRDALSRDVGKSMIDMYKAAQKLDASLPAFNGSQVFFVNSDKVDAKLDKTYTSKWIDPDSKAEYRTDYDKTVKLKDGIYAIVMKKTVAKGFETHLLEGSGSTPSAYQVEKQKHGDGRDPLTDPTMRDAAMPTTNDTRLDKVKNSTGCKRLAALPDDSPMKQPARAASQMVDGLAKALGKLDAKKLAAFKDNKLVANALDKIDRLMEVMPTYTEDAPRFARLFDLLVDEVYLVLATCKPYGKDDYRNATKDMINERVPALTKPDMKDVKHTTTMVSSGMGGMSTAVAAAFSLTGSTKLHLIDGGGDHSSNYFEIETNLLSSDVQEDAGTATGGKGYTPPVIMGTLNPSTPVNTATDSATSSWTVGKLITEINKVLTAHAKLLTEAKPAVAIIDITVEKNGSGEDQEINKVVSDPLIKTALQDGTLRLLLAKSYQKYPSLGAGKAMSGGLTAIGKGLEDDKEPLKTMLSNEDAEAMIPDAGRTDMKDGYDESQIVTHFMTHERDVEREMLERAAKNAKFVRGFMPEDKDVTSPQVAFDEGLPFIVFKKDSLTIENPKKKGKTKNVNVSTALHQQGVEERMSFGFQNTSCLGFGDLMRVGVGQESEEDLIEKLYAITNVTSRPAGRRDTGVNPEDMKKTVGQAANKAMAKVGPALAVGRDSPEWRDETAKLLVAQGTLKDSDVKRDKQGHVTAPGDDVLRGHMETASNKAAKAKVALDMSDHLNKTSEDFLSARRLMSETKKPKSQKQIMSLLHAHAVMLDDKKKPLPAPKSRPKKPVSPSDDMDAMKPDELTPKEMEERLELIETIYAQRWREDALKKLESVKDLLPPTDRDFKVTREKGLITSPTDEEFGSLLRKLDAACKPVVAAAEPALEKNNPWRERMVRVLLSAGKIKHTDVVRTGELILKPSDKQLQDLLDTITTDTSDGDLAKLSEKMALVSGMREPRVGDKALDLSLKSVPQMPPVKSEAKTKDSVWCDTAVRDLIRRNALKKESVKRDTEGNVTSPSPDWLTKKLKEIEDGWAGKAKTALIDAGLLSASDAETIAKDTLEQKFKEYQDGWIEETEKALTARGIELPTDTGPARVDALRSALHDADDANLFHAGVAKEWDGPGTKDLGFEAQFLPNIAASCANLISTHMEDPNAFSALADTLIDNGLDMLSPEGRERLLQRRATAGLAGEPAEILADLDKIGKAAAEMPYREGPANLILGKDLSEALDRKAKVGGKTLTDDNIKTIVDRLSGPLDLSTQVDLLDQLDQTITDVTALSTKKGKKKPAEQELIAMLPAKKKLGKQLWAVVNKRMEDAAKTYTSGAPTPMATPDIRKGSKAMDTHGPQPMPKGDFDTLAGRVTTLQAKFP